MKIDTKHWLGISVLLTVVWLGMMVWLSYKYLMEKDPVRVELWHDSESRVAHGDGRGG